jgi:LmeA-like phospholipid-binding
LRRIGLFIVGAGVVVLILLALAQLVLPGIAAQRLRDRLNKSGNVLDVKVSAFPAIKLLWHHADSVTIRMGSYRSSVSALTGNLAEVGDVGTLDASAALVRAGLLTLRNATLQKHGDELTGSATVTEADLRSSLPILDSVQPVASSGGQLTLQGTATVLGLTATVDATVRPQNGALVVSPQLPFGGLATITVFSSPSIEVEGVAASSAPGGFRVTAEGRVR